MLCTEGENCVLVCDYSTLLFWRSSFDEIQSENSHFLFPLPFLNTACHYNGSSFTSAHVLLSDSVFYVSAERTVHQNLKIILGIFETIELFLFRLKPIK